MRDFEGSQSQFPRVCLNVEVLSREREASGVAGRVASGAGAQGGRAQTRQTSRTRAGAPGEHAGRRALGISSPASAPSRREQLFSLTGIVALFHTVPGFPARLS